MMSANWSDVAIVIAVFFFMAVLYNGWPGRRGDDE